MAKIRIKSAGKILSWLVRGIAATLKFEVEDRAAMFGKKEGGFIWAFWHDRLFLVPWFYEHWFSHIPGQILTSPSADGQIIADLCAAFGLESARGSSSRPRQGMSALIDMAEKMRAGYGIGLTPDGPRGPKHVLQPGVVKLAQLTGGGIIPVHIRYSHAIRFKTWDRFMLPLPFSTVKVIFDAPHMVPRRMSDEEFERHRAEIEHVMVEGTIDPKSSC
jgi:Kdo2-lipid IVA 3' secondary acyltransferase